MKKSCFTTIILLATLAKVGCAQLPIQVLGGHQAIEYNFFWYKDLDKKGKVNLFNFTFFSIDYKDRNRNAYEIYQIATYNFTKAWGIAGGGRFTGGQFAPQMAISYQFETRHLYLNIFPTLQYFGYRQEAGFSLFGLVIYRPKINDAWRMFHQILFEPLFDATGHLYSYQQIRIGLDYKGLLQWGLGANLEQVGSNFELRQNYGLFIRKEFN